MNRLAIRNLLEWKNSETRKPLILQGARQVGKTWLMMEFGKLYFEKIVYLNFEKNIRLKDIFKIDLDVNRIISILEIETNQKINAENTLIIFDEIQEVENGLTSLKYFSEDAPQYYIIAAGSLLGVALQSKQSFPVGKVDFVQLYPLSFYEFLENSGENQLKVLLETQNWNLSNVFHDKLIELQRLYYFIGGMPEVVADYIKNKNLESLRLIQERILLGYENDFAKHAPNEIVPRIRMVWNAIQSQLAKENKKFIYNQIKKSARAKDFEMAINWLIDAGLILKINKVETPKLPLKAYADIDSFKLYLLDIGLLNAQAGLEPTILLEKNNILSEFKGALSEQYVCQQLYPTLKLHYWTATNATSEVDFVFQAKNQIIPLEVKAEENLKSKSLKVYADKYKPSLVFRSSMKPFKYESWLINVPLYAVHEVLNIENENVKL